ncbi:hypothetical protein ABZ370_31915 [Streptomyces sp. NPDC005962]|uniref:hypothetical protein n=1 Tax=Streptomyces sp. NPDC005962 TaxID=3154466 RepID=UPI0033E7F6E9
MASVLGLLESRESAARERIERLREEAARVASELEDAEVVLERLVIARETVSDVLAGPVRPDQDAEVGAREAVCVLPDRGARTGTVVPQWREGLAAEVLAPDYQRIMAVLASRADAGGMRAGQLAAALGLEAVPAKVEGLRSKLKRLVERGWAAESAPGVFSAKGGSPVAVAV